MNHYSSSAYTLFGEICILGYARGEISPTVYRRHGIHAAQGKSSVIVTLPKTPETDWSNPTFDLVEGINPAVLHLIRSERGGGFIHRGEGEIVCGSDGRPLRPSLPKHEPGPGGMCAEFRDRELVIVRFTRPALALSIEEQRLHVEGSRVIPVRQTLFSGRYRDAPEPFKAAAQAAKRKSYCRGCRGVHYPYDSEGHGVVDVPHR